MNILITHECSGVVRNAILDMHPSWNVRSCDLKPSEDGSPLHYQGDALEIMRLKEPVAGWDFIGMHPECRFLTVSGLHWNDRGRGWEKTEQAFDHVMACARLAESLARRWYLENSIGILSTRWRKPDCIVQPYQFGDDASKATCFWTHGLPPLKPTNRIPGRIVNGRERWSNQTDSGQNRLGPSEKRSADRARTYPGIARAIAQQWAAL